MNIFRNSCYLWIALSSLANADLMIDSRGVSRVSTYTGEEGEASVSYISFENWMESRKDDDLPKDIYERGFILDDPELVSPLYEIANRLLEGWPGSAPKLSIFVRVDSASSVYGGESLASNELLVFYGTLMSVESDDELAAVIAHELSHILLEHTKEVSYIETALQRFEDYERIKNLRDIVVAGHITKDDEIEFDSSLESDLLRARAQRERASELYYGFHNSVFGRSGELEADKLAMDLLIRAGYSPIGLRHSLERLGSSYNLESLVSDLMSNSSKTLFEATEKAIAEQIDSFDDTGELADKPSISFKGIGKGIVDSVKDKALDFAWTRFKSSHPVPDSRLEGLAKYLDENFSLRQRAKKVDDENLSEYRRSSAYVAIESYSKVEQAKTALANGEMSEAAAQGIAALSSASDNDAYKRFIAHRIRRDQGQLDSALTNISRIDNFTGAPNSALAEMVDLLIANNRVDEAQNAVAQKERYAENITNFYPAKIQMALLQENQELASSTAVKCLADNSATDEIKGNCLAFGLVDQDVESNKAFTPFKSIGSSLRGLTGSDEAD